MPPTPRPEPPTFDPRLRRHRTAWAPRAWTCRRRPGRVVANVGTTSEVDAPVGARASPGCPTCPSRARSGTGKTWLALGVLAVAAVVGGLWAVPKLMQPRPEVASAPPPATPDPAAAPEATAPGANPYARSGLGDLRPARRRPRRRPLAVRPPRPRPERRRRPRRLAVPPSPPPSRRRPPPSRPRPRPPRRRAGRFATSVRPRRAEPPDHGHRRRDASGGRRPPAPPSSRAPPRRFPRRPIPVRRCSGCTCARRPSGADVLIDGQVEGKTPFQRRIFDPNRTYALTVRKRGLRAGRALDERHRRVGEEGQPADLHA